MVRSPNYPAEGPRSDRTETEFTVIPRFWKEIMSIGVRKMMVSTTFLEDLLTGGVGAAAPENVPKDLRILAVRSAKKAARIELLVSSGEFDGGSEDSWGAPIWLPIFRRRMV